MTLLLGNLLGIGHYDFYTLQYQLCDIDFSMISTRNHCGKESRSQGPIKCKAVCVNYKLVFLHMLLFLLSAVNVRVSRRYCTDFQLYLSGSVRGSTMNSHLRA